MRTRRLVLVLFLAFSCKRRSEDEAARARIFSAEQPVGAAAEAKEPLNARGLADDARLARRVLDMPQGEIAQRLGPHKAQQRVQFAWFRGPGLPDGGSEVTLAEETTLLDAPGDDFSLRLSNDHNQGFELVWVKGEVFVRGLFGPFRKRRTDRTDAQRIREQAMSGLATFDRLARGLKLRLVGDSSAEGRRLLRYAVTGSGAVTASKEKSNLPPTQYPENKVDPDTARRLEVWEKEEPSSVSGTILIDAASGAPFACDLQGRFKVASASKGAVAAELELRAALTTSAVGQDPGLKTPRFEPEPSVPHAVKDPLRFLAKGPGEQPPEEAEGPDTEEEEPAAKPQ